MLNETSISVIEFSIVVNIRTNVSNSTGPHTRHVSSPVLGPIWLVVLGSKSPTRPAEEIPECRIRWGSRSIPETLQQTQKAYITHHIRVRSEISINHHHGLTTELNDCNSVVARRIPAWSEYDRAAV